MTVAANQRLCGKCGALASDDVSACVACGGKVVAMRAPEDVLIGRVLDDRFEIRSLLGVGGMGAVYRAYQRSTDREVAIKIIDPRQMSDVNAVRRFLREAKLASQLAHPNTVSVFDFGQSADGYLYLVMELVKGRTLSEILRERPLGLDSAVRIAEQLMLPPAHQPGAQGGHQDHYQPSADQQHHQRQPRHRSPSSRVCTRSL